MSPPHCKETLDEVKTFLEALKCPKAKELANKIGCLLNKCAECPAMKPIEENVRK